MTTRPLCPCVYCEIDREQGRRQYIARWRGSEDYYGATMDTLKTPRWLAMVFGVRHAAWFGSHLEPLLVGNKKHRLTIAASKRSKKTDEMPARF